MEQSWMDGNVVGGVLSEVFSTDMTAASGRCAGCGRWRRWLIRACSVGVRARSCGAPLATAC